MLIEGSDKKMPEWISFGEKFRLHHDLSARWWATWTKGFKSGEDFLDRETKELRGHKIPVCSDGKIA